MALKQFGRFVVGLLWAGGLLLAQGHSSQAAPYIVVDVTNERVLAHDQAFDRWYPASLTKMMTAYVAFRAIEAGEIALDSPVELSVAAVKVPPSRSNYKAGTRLTLDHALKIVLTRSANDLTMAIGEAISGKASSFVARMNKEAARLGMTGTHFANTNGLPHEKNYSTARDLALLAVRLRRDFPQYAHYFAIEAIDYGDGRKIQPNSNHLIGRYSGADGMKTGFICASGFNLAASATRKGRTLVAVVLGAERIDQREAFAAELLTQGFTRKGTETLTLATLQPYGNKLKTPTNLRETICSAQATKLRSQYRDEAGQLVFDTAFMDVLRSEPKVAKIELLSVPEPLKEGEVALEKVPLPAKRPSSFLSYRGAQAKTPN